MPFGAIGRTIGAIGSGVAGAVGRVAGFALDQIQELGTTLGPLTNLSINEPTEGYNGPLVFPHALRSLDRPLICLTAFIKEDGALDIRHIFLPIPAELSFTDSANYNELNLGAITGAALGAAQAAGGGAGSALDAASNTFNQLKSLKGENESLSSVGADVLQIIKANTETAQQASLLSRTIANPNTNVTFSGHGVRQFTFNFKMIAKDPEESNTIMRIHERFRHYTYANLKDDENNLLLSYPPTWQIRFMAPKYTATTVTEQANGVSLQEITHIPRIFSCYLTNVSTTINGEGNMYYHDNAPLSVDVSLTYQETRALTRNDIRDMENDKLGNRGIDENGNPSIRTQRQESVDDAVGNR
tara:strand:+ start:36 stop:1109 length:1074 start_codon:yes stop_codon:yes gene_type:complete